MSDLRRLRPLILPKAKAGAKRNPGPSPQPLLLKVHQLRVNDTYQRQLSRDSTRMAGKIAVEFDWELYHLLVVSPLNMTDEDTGLPIYEVMDGQHTGIAAVTNGHIKELWCWPGRVDETAQTRAGSFRKLNTQRTAVTPVELFWADVTAEKEEALEVIQACQNTGAKVVKRPKPYGDMKVGETICTENLLNLAEKGGRPYVERILRICVNLRLAPINQMWIRAIEELTLKTKGQHYISGLPSVVDLQIETAVGRLDMDELVRKAKISNAGNNASDRWPVYWWLAKYIKQEVTAHVESR